MRTFSAVFYLQKSLYLLKLQAYGDSASFVPKLTSTVYSYLAPSPNEAILDIGCGDGPLTAQVASAVGDGTVLGLDASASMVSVAQEKHSKPNLKFKVQDCQQLSEYIKSEGLENHFDKVFSNAALHWILRGTPEMRVGVVQGVYSALKHGGTFVFEMGGAGNVAEVHAALIAGLVAHGVPLAVAQGASPWHFPSEALMRQELVAAGLEVEKLETEYRPTKLNPNNEAGTGGLEGWVKLMGAPFLEKVEEGKRQDVVRWVVSVLETVVKREEDGSSWLGYVRLRGIAKKK